MHNFCGHYLLIITLICAYVHAKAHMRRPQDTLWEFILSSHHVGPGDGTQIACLDSKCIDQLNQLSGPLEVLFKIIPT